MLETPYIIVFFALDAFYKEDAPKFRDEALKKFADKMLAFRTELEIIDEYTVNFK